MVSEALTNAAKYSQATVVNVTARAADGTLRLRVGDDGGAATTAATPAGDPG